MEKEFGSTKFRLDKSKRQSPKLRPTCLVYGNEKTMLS